MTKKHQAKERQPLERKTSEKTTNPSSLKRKSQTPINKTTVDTEEEKNSSNATRSMDGLGECGDFQCKTILLFMKAADTFPPMRVIYS